MAITIDDLQDDSELASSLQPIQFGPFSLGRRKKGCDQLKDFPLQPTTQFGTDSGSYDLEASGSFTCYSDKAYESGALHTVILGNNAPLLPSTKYYYRTGDPQFGWSQEGSFVTAPPTSPDSVPYK